MYLEDGKESVGGKLRGIINVPGKESVGKKLRRIINVH